MCSHVSIILASTVTILVSFEAILKRFYVRNNFEIQFKRIDLPQALKYIKIAPKLTSIVTILASIALAGGHILQALVQYLTSIVTILESIEQVNTP